MLNYMKIILNILLILLLTMNYSYSQKITEIRIRLSSQEQVDSFPIKYPEINTVTSLYIKSNKTSPIYNLDSLQNITNIIEFLSIESNDKLNSITGLKNVNSVNTLSFVNNDKIISLSGFISLSKVRHKLKLAGNRNLYDIKFLDNLDLSSIEFLSIRGNEKIDELHLNGNMRKVQYLSIDANYNLKRVILQNLDENLIYISISANENLTSIDFLSQLKSIKRIFINFNYNLKQILLPNLTLIEEEIELLGNRKLSEATFLAEDIYDKNIEVRIRSNPLLSIIDFNSLCILSSVKPKKVKLKNNLTDCKSGY